MKSVNINTKKNIINNGVQFPELVEINSDVYYSNSTGYTQQYFQNSSLNSFNYYCICTDWVQTVCTCSNPLDSFSKKYSDGNIIAEKISVHNNPNFRFLHRIIFNGNEVMDVYSMPNNSAHELNEVQIKIANHLLYQENWVSTVEYIWQQLGLTFTRLSRLDIALDGELILKIIDHLNKYSRSHTVQIGNAALKILPIDFNKNGHKWTAWKIGNAKSGISARAYDKLEELQFSHKYYIPELWIRNGINTDKVGRFEISLLHKRLKKYKIDSLSKLNDIKFLCSLFEKEVRPWLRMFAVKKRDMLNHKKEVAIKRGREINYIKWNHLPDTTSLLPTFEYVSDATYNARNYITFGLREIRKTPTESHDEEIKVIKHYATKYELMGYLSSKTQTIFGKQPDPIYSEFLAKLRFEDPQLPKDVF